MLVPSEKMIMMGLPVDKMDFGANSAAEVCSIAGNAMHTKACCFLPWSMRQYVLLLWSRQGAVRMSVCHWCVATCCACILHAFHAC